MDFERSTECPPENDLELLAVDSEVDPAVRRHVESCDQCASLVEEMKRNIEFLNLIEPKLKTLNDMHNAASLSEEAVSGYKILSEIHRGGQGIVYKAIQLSTHRKVALKTLLQGSLASERQRRRFEREIEIAGSLRHPNIVTLYDTQTLADGRLVFSMEYIRGVPIAQWARDLTTGPQALDPSQAVDAVVTVMLKICDAVEYAHRHGIIHRDLKPGNIFVDDDAEPHVLDFGLAKVQSLGGTYDPTMTGEFLGSIAYASPEQMQGKPDLVDTRCDVYSLGVVFYEALAGKHPYPMSGHMSEMLSNLARLEPQKPSAHNDVICHDLETIVLTAMAKDPQRRYQSVGALKRDIEHCMSDEPIDARRDSKWYVLHKTVRRYRHSVIVACAIVFLSLIYAMTMSVLYRRAEVLYERAVEAEKVAEHRLRESEINRAGLLVAAQSPGAAEAILWNKHLTEDWSIPSRINDGGGPYDTRWSLRDLYHRQPCLRTLTGHEGPVLGVRFHPTDTNLLASWGADGTVRLWDLDSSRPSRILGRHKSPVDSAFFNAGGNLFATCETGTGVMRVWDVQSGTLINEFEEAPSRWVLLGFAKDQRLVVRSYNKQTISLLDIQTNQIEYLVDEPEGRFNSFALMPDGSSIFYSLVNAPEHVVRLELSSGRVISTQDAAPYAPTAASREVNGKVFIAGGMTRSKAAYVWEFNSGRVIPLEANRHKAQIRGYEFDTAAKLVASFSDDQTIKIWDLTSGALLRTLRTHSGAVRGVSFSHDGSILATCAWDGLIKIWEPFPAECVSILPGSVDTVFGIGLRPPANDQLISVSLDGTVCVHDAQSLRLERVFQSTIPSEIASMAISHDGRLLAIGGHDADPRISIRDLNTHQLIRELEGHALWVSALSFHPTDSAVLISSSGDGTVKLWNVETGEKLHEFRIGAVHEQATDIHDVAVSPDGALIAAVGRSNVLGTATVVVWNIQTSDTVLRSVVEGRIGRSVAFSPSGDTLAVGADGWGVNLFDIATGELVRVLNGHRSGVHRLRFDPSGDVLASGSAAGLVKLWDVPSGRCLITLSAPNPEFIFSLAFDGQGTGLFAGTTKTGGSLLHWDLTKHDRHIAGNLEYQIQRLQAVGTELSDVDGARAWARRIDRSQRR